MAHVRQSRPDSDIGFQLKVRTTFNVLLSSLGSGTPRVIRRSFTPKGGLRRSFGLVAVNAACSSKDL